MNFQYLHEKQVNCAWKHERNLVCLCKYLFAPTEWYEYTAFSDSDIFETAYSGQTLLA